MLEELHFKRAEVVSTDAAVLGVARSKWCSLPQASSDGDAQAFMRDHKFDVVPIEHGANVRAYFTTRAWNDFSEVEQCLLGRKDVLDYRTPIRAVIQDLATHDRPYFFLVNGVEVVGLLSIAHLNSRSAKTYLYALVAELEHLVGRFVESKMSPEACVAELRNGSADDGLAEVLAGYDAAVLAGTDSRLAEYLYLRHLIKLALAAELHVALGWSKNKLKSRMNSINDMRNAVAHPARMLVRAPDDVEALWRRVSTIEDLAFTIRTHLMSS